MSLRRWYIINGNIWAANALAMTALGFATGTDSCVWIAFLSATVAVYSMFKGYSI